MRKSLWNSLPLTPSLLALLLLGAGGCGGNAPGGSPPPSSTCVGDPVEDDPFGYGCREAPLVLVRRPPDYRPEEGVRFRLGDWIAQFYVLDRVQHSFEMADLQEAIFGSAIRYYRLPGFPEARFAIGRAYPANFWANCVFNPPPHEDGKCSFVPYIPDRPDLWDWYLYWLGNAAHYYPQVFYTIVSPGSSAARVFYPLVQGKDGSTEATAEVVYQYQFPTDRSYPPGSHPVGWTARPDLGLIPNVNRGPYFTLDDLLQAFRDLRGPDWGKSFVGTLRFRLEFLGGEEVRAVFAEHTPEGEPFARVRRERRYDARPLSEGYFHLLRQVTQDPGMRRGAVVEALRPENTYRVMNDDFYVFEEASGHVVPPAPLCLPGGPHQVLTFLGPYQPRTESAEPYARPGDYARFPYLNYTHHLVVARGREARVVGYWASPNLIPGAGVGPGGDTHPLAYPLTALRGPEPFQPGTERWAVFYRSTARLSWEPSPDHTPYEDRWKVVWSDVRMEGTGANPRCGVDRIGFHVFSREESLELDRFFGLAETEEPSRAFYGTINYPPSDSNRGPMLTRLYRPAYVEGATGYMDALTAVAPGEVQVPLLPPGW